MSSSAPLCVSRASLAFAAPALIALAACAAPAAPAGSPRAAAPAAAPAAAAQPTPPFAVQVTGHGPPMILIPGLASSGEVWAGTAEHERDRFTCHVLTLPGFAGQPRIAGPLLTTMRDAIAAYIVAARLDHPVIVGHSLGGVLALELAIEHPDLVGPLVIVDSLPFLAAAFVPSATAETARGLAEQLRQGMLSRTGAEPAGQRAMIATMVTRPADRDRALAWTRASDRTAVADGMFEVLTTDLREAVAGITAPALVIGTWQGRPGGSHAETEQVFLQQYARQRGVQLAITDRARHFVMLDDPEFLFGQMDAFLARTPAPGH